VSVGGPSSPAGNGSGPYADQLALERKTLAPTAAWGGIGYSWWQFKDVRWGKFHADHMGVMDRHGWTAAGPGLPPVEGTIKPVASAFMGFDPDSVQGSCVDRKSTRLNSSHVKISYAVFCLKKKK